MHNISFIIFILILCQNDNTLGILDQINIFDQSHLFIFLLFYVATRNV